MGATNQITQGSQFNLSGEALFKGGKGWEVVEKKDEMLSLGGVGIRICTLRKSRGGAIVSKRTSWGEEIHKKKNIFT